MERAEGGRYADAAVHSPTEGGGSSKSGILDSLMIAATVTGFIAFVFSLLQPHSIFPDAWFPSAPAALAFKIVFCAWIFSEIVHSLLSSKNSGAKTQDRGSYWVVVGAILAAMLAVFLFRSFGAGSFSGTGQYAGLLLAIAGIALREWTIWTLGSHFTVRVQIREKARLVTRGPYSYIRHPSYTGSLLTCVGLSWFIGSWLGTLFVLGLFLTAYEYRIRVEEKALQEAFGTEYVEYKRRTWKLFPGF